MKYKKQIVLVLFLVGVSPVFAQQDPQFSMYMFNPLAVNPAYAGSREVLSMVAVHRSQWVGLEGTPETQAASINTPLRNKKMGLGLQIVNDRIGPRTTQNITGIYAYRIKVGLGKLAFGLKAGIIAHAIDRSKISYKEQETAAPITIDDNFLKPTVDFGMYYNSKTFYVGMAAEHLNELAENPSNTSTSTTGLSSGVVQFNELNLIGTVGKAFKLNRDVILKASALVRVANNTRNLDITSGILLKNKVFFGASLRSSKALIAMVELNISKYLRAGVGYDFDRSSIAQATAGSIEVFVGYDIGLFRSKVISPRYF